MRRWVVVTELGEPGANLEFFKLVAGNGDAGPEESRFIFSWWFRPGVTGL
jgi:hypothetical protein